MPTGLSLRNKSMVYLPTKPVKGKHYEIYKEAKGIVKSKSQLLKEALQRSLKIAEHADFVDFIPAKFTLQLHGWFKPDAKEGYTKLSEVVAQIKSALNSGKDPIKGLRGKWHYDLRVWKLTAPTWFGMTLFRAPWTGTMTNKVQGVVKGYQSLVPGSKALEKFLSGVAQKKIVTEGVRERQDRLEWMKIKGQWFDINSPGNPQKNEPAVMVAIEFYEPAVLHRRQLDFIDLTFLGKYLKGRFYYRLVERKKSPEELQKWQVQEIQEHNKPMYALFFYLWKAKDQFDMTEMMKVATQKFIKDPIPAPPSKDKTKKTVKVQPPLHTKEFH